VIAENYRRFACTQCAFSFTKTPSGRQFEIPEVETLLTEGEIGPLQGFRSKMGRPFAAILRIIRDEALEEETGSAFKMEFDFGNNNESEAGEEVDFSGQEALGKCPKCGGAVFEHGMSYSCENTPPKRCDFRSGKVILQQEISREQMHKLLTEGKTDLLQNFVSNRNGRKFKAFLALDVKAGKVGFEFAPREPKVAKGAAAKTEDETAAPAAKTARKTAARKTTA
jgi:DNA topoisomerase-3